MWGFLDLPLPRSKHSLTWRNTMDKASIQALITIADELIAISQVIRQPVKTGLPRSLVRDHVRMTVPDIGQPDPLPAEEDDNMLNYTASQWAKHYDNLRK